MVHVQICTGVPFVVFSPAASRHRPDSRPTIVPSGFNVQCWLAPPLQVKISTAVPGVTACAGTSRHLLQ